MLDKLTLENTLFLDIETVSQYSDYQDIPDEIRPLWEQKGGWIARRAGEEWAGEVPARTYEEKAAIYAEFGRVIVISVGYLRKQNDEWTLKLKSFADVEEKIVLQAFSALVTQHFGDPARHFLCGHNIKEFDIPYLCRRMIIHGLPLPNMLDVTGKKPWETAHFIDTMDLWKFGDYKNFTSLHLLASVLGIPTPKDDIDGSDVGRVFWKEGDLDRIARYCEKDVATCVRVLMRFKGEQSLQESRIESVTS